MLIPDSTIQSAQITADAWEEPCYVFAGSEHAEPDPICLRGRFFTSRSADTYAGMSWHQFPVVAVFCVLPWGYFRFPDLRKARS